MDMLWVALAALVVLVFLWFALCAAVRRWQGRFVQRAMEVGGDLKGVRRELAAIEQGAQRYLPGDPEPYGTPARDLHRALAQAREALAGCARQRRQLLRQVPALPGRRLARSCLRLWPQPRPWWQLDQEAESLAGAAQALRAQVDRAAQQLAGLQAMPLAVARRCRRARGAGAETAQIAQALSDAGVHGEAIAAAAGDAARLRMRLQEGVPPPFLERDEGLIARQAKEDAIRAWQVLEEVEAPIQARRQQFQAWHARHRQAGHALRLARQAAGVARERLARVPSAIDIAALRLELARAGAALSALEGLYRAPAIEALDALHARAGQVAGLLDGLIAESDAICARFDRLHDAIPLHAALLDRIAFKMSLAACAARYPIDWGACARDIARLRQIEVQIGAIAARRTPDQLREHVAMAGVLEGEGRALEDRVDQARAWREALVPLLERPDLAADPPWLAQAERVHQQAGAYAAANWPPEHAVPGLLDDARALADCQRQWVPVRADAPLPAAGLDRRLDEVQRLAADLEAFGGRLQRAAERLAAIQEMECTARQELEVALPAVGRLLERMEGAVSPFDAAVAGRWQRLGARRREGQRLAAALEQRGKGRVEDKVARVGAWVRSGQQALEGLAQALGAEREAAVAALQDEVEALQALAPFDREPAVQEAQKLLAERPPDLLPAAGDDDGTAARVALLARRAEEGLPGRERLHGALQGVRSQVRAWIDGPWQAWQEARQEALARSDALREWKARSEAGWPPLLCDTRRAEDLLERARRDEERLRDAGRTTSGVLDILERIVARYREAIAEVEAREEENDRAWPELRALGERNDRWRGQLEAYGRAHRRDPAVLEAVQARLAAIDQAMARAQRKHRRHPLPYEGARQVLEDLWSLAHDEDLPVKGSDRAIGVEEIEAEIS